MSEEEEIDDYDLSLDNYKVTLETYRVYRIANIKNGRVYRVWRSGDRENHYTCSCPAFDITVYPCKHIKMILKLEGKIQ